LLGNAAPGTAPDTLRGTSAYSEARGFVHSVPGRHSGEAPYLPHHPLTTQRAATRSGICRATCTRSTGTSSRALAAAGARPDQVTKITIFVVGYRRDECLPTIEDGRVALFGDHKPADTLVGVEALSPGYLIEVEAIAVVDG
jgi:enamine deaminase RidA (YjgF/YER057c/UK114 family)